jgi:fatty acid desaturase
LKVIRFDPEKHGIKKKPIREEEQSMTAASVPERLIRQQAWKYYLLLLLWPAYLFFLPWIFARLGIFSLLYMVFPGIYLFTWVGFLMHESWHKYVPNIPNGFFYNAFALMLLSDPQLYQMTHGYHHSKVHTYEDAEFHPVGAVRNPAARIIYNWLEVIIGVAWLVLMASLAVPFDPRFSKRYRIWKLPFSLLAWGLLLGGIGFLAHRIFGVTLAQIVIPFAASIWLNSFALHQSQLMEHGNLYVDGSFDERNIWTRNLKRAGVIEKIILFFTHGDSEEHVLHHTLTKQYLRPFPGVVPLPANAVSITFRDYLRILGRMLAGKEDHFAAGTPAASQK